ncbi:uncharacterized protein LOC132735866 [Ruditapes philippinarum]|uniref:uncharacterized protein LOC132735866 n=1 Tax=Ruditapes philippinarum TaxID=129788 RepID=UPI00295B8A7B|nr:uncharacterized protein LOC132735866 [Ruditapes philippinarum]
MMNNTNTTVSNTTNLSVNTEMKDGYDLPVTGLASGYFYSLHSLALSCMLCSFVCAVIVLTFSFRAKTCRDFFKGWSKGERFIVYMALIDGSFNVFHSLDHLHHVIAMDHVRPKELCQFYAFVNVVFVNGQNLMVNIVAFNAFMLMYFDKNLDFGKADWKLLTWIIGMPFVGASIAQFTGTLGPTGSFCFVDGVRGFTANVCLTTVPLLIIVLMNSVMYGLTWKRIREKTKALKHFNKVTRQTVSKSRRAAISMSMFVVAFFIQWTPLAIMGLWLLLDTEVPLVLFYIVTTFTNLGGCLNFVVFLIIRHRNRQQSSKNERRHNDLDEHKNTHTNSNITFVSTET